MAAIRRLPAAGLTAAAPPSCRKAQVGRVAGGAGFADGVGEARADLAHRVGVGAERQRDAELAARDAEAGVTTHRRVRASGIRRC